MRYSAKSASKITTATTDRMRRRLRQRGTEFKAEVHSSEKKGDTFLSGGGGGWGEGRGLPKTVQLHFELAKERKKKRKTHHSTTKSLIWIHSQNSNAKTYGKYDHFLVVGVFIVQLSCWL